MHQPLLVQPPSGGRLSGGYLYNARMSEAGLWAVLDLPSERLTSLNETAAEHDVVLMDSIWLTEEHAPFFLALRPRVARIGLVLHAFPSMILAADSGRAPPTEPTRFEREFIDHLDVVLLPGPHYRDLLEGAKGQIVIAEPGVDDAGRAEPRQRNGVCRLVSVGALTTKKK